MENSLSLAAIEAELKPKVMEAFDKIANEYKRLRRLQDQDIANQLQNESLSPGAGAQVQEDQGRAVAEVKSLRSTRRASTRWSSSSTTSTSASSPTKAA
jgi:RNA polymerase primary sigma factor